MDNELEVSSLHGKMAKGTLWTLLEKTGSQAISFVVFAIIARLVGPEEYGLVAICYVYLSLASAILLTMVDSIVTLHVSDDRRLSTLFWASLACGFALSVFCYAVTAPFAAIMEQPRLVPLLHLFSILPFLLSLSVVPSTLIIASMHFKIFAIRTFMATITGGLVGIVMAFYGFGAFALVGQQLVLFTVTNIVVWQWSPWHPRLLFSYKDLMALLKPGLNMSGHSLISFIDQQVPRLLLGYFLGPVVVGYYSFATRIRQSFQEVIVHPLSDVSYPAFAILTKKIHEQKKILSQLMGLTATLAFLAVAGIIATAPIFVPLFFGEKWNPAIPALQLFLITGMTQPMMLLFRNLLRVHNRLGPYLRTQAVFTIISFIMVFLLAPQGLVPVALGLVALSLLGIPVYLYLVAKETKVSLWRDLGRLVVPLIAAVLLIISLYVFDNSVYFPENKWVHLLTDAALGLAVYGTVCFALQFRQMMAFVNFVKKLRK